MAVFEISRSRFSLTAKTVVLGNDVLVIVSGGKAHIGAVAISYIAEATNQPGHSTVTTSLITLPGHKDDIVAIKMGRRLAEIWQKNVVVVAGLHWDDISGEEIVDVLELVDDLCDKIGVLFGTTLDMN